MTSGLGHWGTDTDNVYIIASHTRRAAQLYTHSATMRPLLVGWVLLVILNLSLQHVCDLKHAEEQTKVRIRAGNEPSRSLKFHNHREGPY